MGNYNRNDPDAEFIISFRDSVTALPLILILCIVVIGINTLFVNSGDSLFFLLLFLTAVIVLVLLPFYYIYLLLRAFTEMLILQKNSLETLDEIYNQMNLSEESKDKSAQHQVDEELPEI